MTKLPIALTALAVAAASTIALSTSADAGGRGHFRFHHFHFSPPLPVPPPQPAYVYRKPRVVKPVARSTPAPVVKYADDEGRKYDRVSKTWFDGVDSCWKGSKTFAYRSGAWFYGNARWVQTSTGWGVSSGDLPEQVDCAGVKAFASKIKPTTTAASDAPVNEAPKPDVVKQTPARTVAPMPAAVETKAPDATANASDCKKYLPSLGETVSVPCT
jgi:hypothetical protein